MSIVTVREVLDLVAGGRTVAGLDLGEKTIGLAISDRNLAFAHPRPVILRGKFTADANSLVDIFAREHVAAAAIGLPVNMDGSEGPRAQATRAFVRNFARVADIPFLFWDERMSTVAAERALIDMDVSRAKRSKRIDSAAAAFILQGVLDRLKRLRMDELPA